MIAQYIEAPNNEKIYRTRSIFLGGGITGCEDWQTKVIQAIKQIDLAIINPRRKRFDVAQWSESEKQIRWEHRYLRQCSQVVFYFPPETVCPITLFELGAALERRLHTAPNDRQDLFIACHPDYARKADVGVQSRLQGVLVGTSLDMLIGQILDFNRQKEI